MPLAKEEPKLDDRSFEQIYRDLRARIPRYSKEWTNFNDSDPGITLLQLFAWLSDMMLVRMNQIPKKNYIKFLQLLGQELEPAKPATTHLTFSTKASQVAETVPERAQVSAQIADGGPAVIFETTQALDLIQAPLAVVGAADAGTLVNVTAANDKKGTKFRPLGWFAQPGSALHLGFEKLPDDILQRGVKPFPGEMTFRIFLPPEATSGKPQQVAAPIPPSPVSLVWEYRPKDGSDWERLNVFVDESAGFLREGYIRVQGPEEIEPSKEPRLGPDPRYWLRVRLDSGVYPEGHGPEIDFLRPNTVDAESLATVTGTILGQSEGGAGESFTLPFQPVQPASLKVSTELNGQTEAWTRVDDFLSSSTTDAHYVLNATEGAIRFGDGDRGRIVEAGTLVVADAFRYGGGARANSAGAGAIASLLSLIDGVDKVTNERPAVGGQDEQTIEDLQREAPAKLSRQNRAVTAQDFISFAKEAGGVANATAIVNGHPDFPGVEVPGAVTVVIVPDTGEVPPVPSSGLIASVCSRLDAHRLITTEVYVKGPEYREVRVEAFVEAAPNSAFDAVSRNIATALDAFLNPKTWTFGDDLYPTEIFKEVLDADPNVIAVRNLNIYIDGRLQDGLGQIAILPGELVFGRNHLIVVTPAVNR
jgi:hypothetical protein